MKKYLKIKNIAVTLLLVFFLTINFNYNIFVFDSEGRKHFNEFQCDSESLVLGQICKDINNFNNNWGLQRIILNEDGNYVIEEYKSQYGLQGRIFSFLYNNLKISLNFLKLSCSFLLAGVILMICYLLKEKFGKLFFVVFLLGFALSPWVINFARNLYWVEFTWFLPLLFCLLLQKTNNKRLFLPLYFLSVLIKCLCGYEYLSTILFASITFYLLDFFMDKERRKDNFKMIFIIGTVAILAFVIAMLIHVSIEGNGDLLKGLDLIYRETIMKRTIFGNKDYFEDEIIKKSFEVTYLEVFFRYHFFNTDLLIGIPGIVFNSLYLFSIYFLIFNYFRKKEDVKRDSILFVLFLIAPYSWFILAKAHSYVHYHMNYVLWYFGFVQMSFYIVIKNIYWLFKNIKNERKK